MSDEGSPMEAEMLRISTVLFGLLAWQLYSY